MPQIQFVALMPNFIVLLFAWFYDFIHITEKPEFPLQWDYNFFLIFYFFGGGDTLQQQENDFSTSRL